MAKAKPRADCPDCHAALEQIQLVGKTGLQDVVVDRYAAAQEKPGWLSQRIKASGALVGMMCPQCGRVLMYAERW